LGLALSKVEWLTRLSWKAGPAKLKLKKGSMLSKGSKGKRKKNKCFIFNRNIEAITANFLKIS
jgi:hypothetical protein